MSKAAMVIAGVAIGTVAGRYLLLLLWRFRVRDSRSLRILVPASTAIALGIAGGVLGTTWDVLPIWALFIALVGVSTVDLFHYRIPNAIVFPTVAVLLVLMTLISMLRNHPGAIGQAVAAAGFYGVIMSVLYVFSGGSLGLGDVKLALPIGLVLGWVASGYGESLLAVFLAFVLASFFGATMGLTVWGMRKWGNEVLPDPLADPSNPRPTVFPFAPCIAVAAAAMVLAIPVAS
ncbi:MAG: A24 family peptidase [bacterium]|nr:A24 family peptidase [bacterium]